MAAIVASLLPPLLVHGRKSHAGNMQSFPLSSPLSDGRKSHAGNLQSFPLSSPLSERRKHVAFVVKASGESSESSTSLTIFKTVQNVWDKPEDRVGLIGLGFAAIVALWASANLITAVDKLPIIPNALELIGILFSVWFTYRFLLFKPDREELLQILNKSVSDILGQ